MLKQRNADAQTKGKELKTGNTNGTEKPGNTDKLRRMDIKGCPKIATGYAPWISSQEAGFTS
jgi:hypothetical protein